MIDSDRSLLLDVSWGYPQDTSTRRCVMKLKRHVAEALLVGCLALPAGLGMSVANADPPSQPSVPTPPRVPAAAREAATAMANGNKVAPTTTATRFISRGTPAAARTGQGTAMVDGTRVAPVATATQFTSTGPPASAQTEPATRPAEVNGNSAAPTTLATPFSGAQGRSSAEMTGLNPHGQAGPTSTPPLGLLVGLLGRGPLGGLLG